jgi:fimbrial chaperone protein
MPKIPLTVLAATAVLALSSAASRAGDFGVSPIRVDLDLRTRTGVITVSNEGKTPLGFQVRAQEWTQDAAGRDAYADTKDLIYFPQQFQVPPQESRVIRVGYRNPALQREKAYRVFIEELPERSSDAEGRTTVAVAVRFGVPVFLRPAAVEQRGEIAELSIAQGRARGLVRNTGPVHFRFDSVRFLGFAEDGRQTFEHALEGWYLLSGAVRAYEAPLAPEACARTRMLRFEAVGDKIELRTEAAVAASSCR